MNPLRQRVALALAPCFALIAPACALHHPAALSVTDAGGVDRVVLDATPLPEDAPAPTDVVIPTVDACVPGATRECYSGAPSTRAVGACHAGTQRCDNERTDWSTCEGERTPRAEICSNALDDDCDGQIDEDCAVRVDVPFHGNCPTAQCPSEAPYAVGCVDVAVTGDRGTACVASEPDGSTVFFKEGDSCLLGTIGGTLQCSSVRGAPLSTANCPVIGAVARYVSHRDAC